MERRLLEIIFFVLAETFIFSTWFLFLFFVRRTGVSEVLYELNIYLSPVLLIFLSCYDLDLRKALMNTLRSKDVFILIAAFTVWGFIFAYYGENAIGMFYLPAIAQEINFRLVIFNFLRKYMSDFPAVILQALLFMVFYSNYVIFEPEGWPGIQLPIYLIDMLIMGIIYGALYYIRKSIYIDIILHNSLFDLILVLPAFLGFIPYTMLPT
ncbi:MAG: CPBP family intramembrane metalloprotease [Candidatus Thermoplasmatota archaeon]|nr:CPBP family intramembrane metalloprotease [Candidatus Thermoplasmatota archaeon]MCL5666058.1 CPBP family intramembrane metalloprotease [Candidatus Thermoplasmatota archaeon]